MSAIIIMLLSLGLISQPEEATPQMIDQYATECNITSQDIDSW